MPDLDMTQHSWSSVFMALADKMLKYNMNQQGLSRWVSYAFRKLGPDIPYELKFNREANQFGPTDPFTMISLLCRERDGTQKRMALLEAYADTFELSIELPTEFPGLLLVPPEHDNFYEVANDLDSAREALWILFEAAIVLADKPSATSQGDFQLAFDNARKLVGLPELLTIGLFWIRPFAFVGINEELREYLRENNMWEGPLDGDSYLDLLDLLKEKFGQKWIASTFIELAHLANTNSLPHDKRDTKRFITSAYTKQDFLIDVFISEEQYNEYRALLLRKKNIILQGPPGVGKTFSAKRLCYSIMNKKDSNRVQFVQFHQSTTYEDFIMGYRPDPETDSFTLQYGVFYLFCKKAQKDLSRPYFFVVDEINRGNVSKIFGELMMLIEEDKRGEEISMVYTAEPFCVPPNLYLIGMMNTADRSLAVMDYALRRRFAFCDMKPMFESEQFRKYQQGLNNPKFNKLVETMISLNAAIQEDITLGEGFMVGHSYLCNCEFCDQNWLESVVRYDILPLLKEYWFDEQSKYQKWADSLLAAIR